MQKSANFNLKLPAWGLVDLARFTAWGLRVVLAVAVVALIFVTNVTMTIALAAAHTHILQSTSRF